MTAASTLAAPRPQRLGMIEAGRALAALAVVFFHADTLVGRYLTNQSMIRVFGVGERGVDFFFVLSGFIIAYVHAGDLGQREKLLPFAKKRFARIYPLLWAVVTATVALNILVDGESYGFMRLWSSYTLWPSLEWTNPAVVWTLRHEILFYALFGIVIASRRIGMLVIIAWLAAVLAQTALLLAGRSLPGVAAMLFSPLNLQFAAGCVAALVFLRHGDRYWKATLTIGLALMLALSAAWVAFEWPARQVLAYGNPEGVRLDLAFAGVFGLVVHGLAGASGHVATPRTVLLVGAASYAIYLVHSSVLGIAARFLPLALPSDGLAPLLPQLLLALVALAAGIVTHLVYERPVSRIVRGWLLGKSGRQSASGVRSAA